MIEPRPGASTLAADHGALVRHVATTIYRRARAALEYDELVGVGMLGLIQAAEAFDPTRGFAFSTFAVPRIRGAMLDDLRRRQRNPDATADMPTSVLKGFSDAAAGPVERLLASEHAARVRAAVDRLPERERFVINQYYWRDETDRAISRRMGCTPQNVWQLRATAINRLRRSLSEMQHAA